MGSEQRDFFVRRNEQGVQTELAQGIDDPSGRRARAAEEGFIENNGTKERAVAIIGTQGVAQ